MLTLTCTRGLPGSGKSTWAKEQDAVRVSRDDLRFSMFGKYWGLNYQQENLITYAERAMAVVALKSGANVVVDAMHLRPKYLADWNTLAVKQGAVFSTVEFPTDVQECIRRDRYRERSVGMKVIRDQAEKYMPKGKFLTYQTFQSLDGVLQWEPVPFDPDLPHCILVDLDGTMTLGPRPHRSPYDWKRCGEDKPRRAVVNLVNRLLRDGYLVVFLSGRDSICRAETIEWLGRYVDNDYRSQWTLHMRPEGDSRKDDIVKSELYDRYVLGQLQPKFVLDDRDQVVAMWRARGLACFQVAPGDF